MIILIHTSKTMRPPVDNATTSRQPQLIARTKKLASHLKTLPVEKIAKVMGISPKLAIKTHALIAAWSADPTRQRSAIDSFLGDIYSGLQVADWTESDRQYADEHLRILSGLYGVLRPLDGIYPYRLEMGYRWDNPTYGNLYKYWGSNIGSSLPAGEPIINLAAVEYSKTVTPFVDIERIITPSFLTISPKTGEPMFVVVHAKIARGAFARWMIRHRIDDVARLHIFNELNYRYDERLSTPNAPIFICQTFGGLGLSVRLT